MRSNSVVFSSLLLSAIIVVSCASAPKQTSGVFIATLNTAPLTHETVTLKVYGFD